jgi:ABC-2 type transport system permease protein
MVSGHARASGADFAIPAQIVEFGFFLAPFTGFLFFRDHGWKTWSRLRASPASSADIVAGKAAPMVALGLLQVIILSTVGSQILHLHLHGEALALLPVAFTYVCCSVAVGVALTAVLRTSQQLNAIGFLGATLMGALGGALVPIATLPVWTRAIAPVTPQYWAMRSARDVILNHQPASAVTLPVLILAMFTAGFVVIAVRRLRMDHAKIGWT